ncbi:MAG: DUF11 domain-containing protein, partial [Anaerolineae bacterium]|nr:DUF11 domain-containing protein [Anaerolineae bacterium]
MCIRDSGSPNDTGGDVPIQYGIPQLPGTAANPRIDAQLQQVGSTWGIAHQHEPLRVYLSSFVRRHVGLGPRGEDGVYVLDYSNSALASVVGGFDLQGVAPINGGPVIDVGTVTRTGSNDYVLGGSGVANVDLDAFDKMGKTSFGDMDIGEDGHTLWLVNLNQRGLIKIDMRNYVPSMANPSFLPSSVISQYLLSPALGEPTCVGGVFRPWGLKFKDLRGYLGGVCDGAVSQQITDVVAHVLSFDPQNPALGFTPVISVAMNYTRENNLNGLGFLADRWYPWASTWAQTGFPLPSNLATGPDSGAYGQPILSDIEFTENGSIVLGFSDRFGHQTGYDQYVPVPSADTLYGGFTSVSSGDLLHVCRTAAGYVIEGRPGCATGELAGGARRVDDGPGGNGEFYHQDVYVNGGATGNTSPTHDEVTLGGLVWLPGSGQVVSTVFDPVDYPVSTSPSNRGLNTVGVHWYNNRSGTKDDGYLVASTGSRSGMGKATSVGDMELLCDPPPTTVGNRVWVDSNLNGIQDPDELGLSNVTVQLVNSTGTVISTTTTNAAGEYYFTGLAHTTPYTIQIPVAQNALAAYTMTLPNATGITNNDWISDVLDSDGQLIGAMMAVSFVIDDAGDNNYGFDFGVRLLVPNVAMAKYTNGVYAPTGTGPQLLVGNTVTWTYVVTNTGEVTLTNFTLVDTPQGAVNASNCAPSPLPNFAPNAVTTCQITGTVTQGQYTNTATITGTNVFSSAQQVTSTSQSHYFGFLPQLAIVKLTNGVDADNAPGPLVAAGGAVTWTYLVTNTGNITLANVAVMDDQVGAISCPANTLNPSTSMTCSATGVAVAG